MVSKDSPGRAAVLLKELRERAHYSRQGLALRLNQEVEAKAAEGHEIPEKFTNWKKTRVQYYEDNFAGDDLPLTMVLLLTEPLKERGITIEEVKSLLGEAGTSVTLAGNNAVRLPVLDVAVVSRLWSRGTGAVGRLSSVSANEFYGHLEEAGAVMGWDDVLDARPKSFELPVWDDRMNDVVRRGMNIVVDPLDTVMKPGNRYVVIVFNRPSSVNPKGRKGKGGGAPVGTPVFARYEVKPTPRLVAETNVPGFSDIELEGTPVQVVGRVYKGTVEL